MSSTETITNLLMMIPSITAIKMISEAGTPVATMMVGRSEGGFSEGEIATDGAEDLCVSPVVVSTSGAADTAISYGWEVGVCCISWNGGGFCHSPVSRHSPVNIKFVRAKNDRRQTKTLLFSTQFHSLSSTFIHQRVIFFSIKKKKEKKKISRKKVITIDLKS